MDQNLTFSDYEPQDEEDRFYFLCAENRVNAMIAQMMEHEELFERPEEFENEAVSMAIQQHGLRNSESLTDLVSEGSSEINENHYNQNLLEDMSKPTTSESNIMNIVEDYSSEEEKRLKWRQGKHKNSEMENQVWKQNINPVSYDGDDNVVDDVEFLNEAVAVAIRKKGLNSCNALK